MQVKCVDCDWSGDSSEGKEDEMSENKHGVEVSSGEVVCPDCGGELVEA